MSLFSWLFPANKPAKAHAVSSGLSRMEPTRPAHRPPPGREHPAGNGRMNEHVAVGDPRSLPQHAVAQLDSQPAALESDPAPLVSGPAPLNSKPAPLAPQRSRYDPIQPDEVEAFKRALAAGDSDPA